MTHTSAACHGSKEWTCCAVVAFLCTWHLVFSTKKKVLVVSALYRSRAVDQYRWVRFAGECLVFLHAQFSAVFSEWQVAALFFFFFSSDPAVTSYLLLAEKKRKEFDYIDKHFWLFVRPNTTFKRSSHPPQANGVPSTIHGKKGMVSVKSWKYTFVLISAVSPQSDAGTCFWFLNCSPVSKGLVCTLSLHLLLVSCGASASSSASLTAYADSLRYDR